MSEWLTKGGKLGCQSLAFFCVQKERMYAEAIVWVAMILLSVLAAPGTLPACLRRVLCTSQQLVRSPGEKRQNKRSSKGCRERSDRKPINLILTKHYEKKYSAGVARGGADMVEMRRIDAFIQNDDYVTGTDVGEIIELQYLSHKNTSAPIKKISKDQYVDLQTGEIKDFAYSENRGQSLDSLRKTFKKLGYLVNNNFSGKKNELWTTLTYADNVQDLKKVSPDFDKFIKRLKYFMANEYGEVREIAYKKKGKNKKYKLNVKNKSKFEFVKVLEPQGRGAWHVHMLVLLQSLKINN